ncbi:LytTR family DNA-binding domain-containing protein [uncultured Arcticibacterium sp.]|uniref:LytR/AlgR family response regulator transcription factor n=1 Tax=uncultured Arcticibacterium sp. TaxID=2173042 RepID=UPI0030F4EB52
MKTIKVSKQPVRIAEIVYMKSDINYTEFFLRNGNKIVSCHTLKRFEEQLPSQRFKRIDKGTLINSGYLKHIGSDSVTLVDNTVLKISRRRKQILSQFNY